jgi:nucleoside-diphosphate-sugar epimerase
VFALVRSSTDGWRLDLAEPTWSIVTADLLDTESTMAAVRFARPTVVFHTAAVPGHFETPSARSIAKAATIMAALNLSRALADQQVDRFVHFGSSLEYGPAREPLSESRALMPVTGRGLVKAEETMYLLQASRTTGMPLTVLRPFSVYGPWEHPSRFVPTLMRSILDGGELQLPRAQVRHDFVYVADVVAAAMRAAFAAEAKGEIINVATGRQFTNEDVVAAAERVCDTKVRISRTRFPSRPVDTDYWVADVRKAQQMLGWSARTDLDEGLRETYRWFVDGVRPKDYGLRKSSVR